MSAAVAGSYAPGIGEAKKKKQHELAGNDCDPCGQWLRSFSVADRNNGIY